jgi:hypothetical protein
MQYRKVTVTVAFAALSGLFASSAHAFDMGNMMNPSKWMGGGNKDRYDDDYYPGGPGYGYPGPGYGYGGYPGYGGPGYGYGGYPGYGGPGYGYGGYPAYGGYPGYGGSSTIVVPGSDSSNSEIQQLKARIRQLEGGVQ